MKILKEQDRLKDGEKENNYAKRIRLVEEYMKEQNVSFYTGNDLWCRVKDKHFRLINGSEVPRMVDDERWVVDEQ